MPYTIDREPGSNRIRYAVTGFWDVATVDRFAGQLRSEIAKAGSRPTILCDARSFAVQARDVAERFELTMLRDIVPRIDRMAVLVATMLNKLQVERGAQPAPNIRTFMHEDEALAWLDGGTEQRLVA